MRAARTLINAVESQSQTSLHEHAIKFLLIDQHKGHKCEPGKAKNISTKVHCNDNRRALPLDVGKLFVRCLPTKQMLGSVSIPCSHPDWRFGHRKTPRFRIKS